MNKLFLVGMLALLLSTSAFAYEQSLFAFGFAGIENTTNSTNICKEILVSLPASAIAENGAGVLSIRADFNGVENDTTYVSVTINGGEEKILWPESFLGTTERNARIFLPNIKNGETKLKICAVLGILTKSVNILSDSKIGVYNTPVLSIENIAPTFVYQGDRAKMSIIVSNTGTRAAEVFVQFIHPDTRAKVPIKSFDIVEGDSSAQTIISPGDSKRFDYYIKPTILGLYNLPSAALFFTNIFGEQQSMLSAHPYMTVAPQKNIEVALVADANTDAQHLKAIIRNNLDTAFSGTIIVSPQTDIVDPARTITVSPNSEKEILFETRTLSSGERSFSATIRDGNSIYSSNTITLQSKTNDLPIQIIIAIVVIVIGAAIFLWIYYSKEN